ncbi:MAG: hypothetical protein F6K22_17675 [Okeania sp. SIO2F4]|uniref:hypothetical protein n=1 Tax=Okeania sp. SIO2F4 TaxID=2607790 RepID=UPI00142B7987|nr:hypothetical protein [Okeania sp. SIO2F4]NES04494.1 hypothetical protein [Okeania sp. SIO2F4]
MSDNSTSKFRPRKHIISLGWFSFIMISSIAGLIKHGNFGSLPINFLIGSVPVAIGHSLDIQNQKKEQKLLIAEQEKRKLKLMEDLALSQTLLERAENL